MANVKKCDMCGKKESKSCWFFKNRRIDVVNHSLYEYSGTLRSWIWTFSPDSAKLSYESTAELCGKCEKVAKDVFMLFGQYKNVKK